MSEYQYYEWLAIDRPLSDAEQAAVDGLSSHIEVSATGAWVEYNWSDFKHDPFDVLARYFDAYLYMANWGTRQLAFRFPKPLLDPNLIDPYIVEDGLDLTTVGEFHILSLELNPEDSSGEWLEGSGWLASLAPLRNDLLLGDTRALYLAWLAKVGTQYGEDEIEEDWEELDELEPPVPPGLGDLSAPLKRLAHFLELDKQLLKAAAAASAAPAVVAEDVLRRALSGLPRSECDDFLWRLLQGELNLSATLRRRLHDLAGVTQPAAQPRRTLRELLKARSRLAQASRRAQAAAANARRVKELEALAQREDEVWRAVDRLIATYQPKAYQEAVAELVRLRELAEFKGTQPAFRARIIQLRQQYARRSSLIAALDGAGLRY